MPDSLHIGLVVGPTAGGVGRHIETVAAGLVERGHRVTVCAPEAAQQTFDWSATGAAVLTAPIGSIRPRDLRRSMSTIRAHGGDWDVTHAHGLRAAVTAVAAGAHPLVVTWHNGPHERLRRRWLHPLLERYACRGADRLLAVSPDLAARARRAGAHEVRVVAVVAPPLPPPRRSAAEVRGELAVGDRTLVLAVARLEPQKRLDVLVDAVTDWPGEDGPLVVVAGTGSLASQLRRRIARSGAPVTLLGRRDDVSDLLAAADIAVLASAWEGYPLIAQEALRAGTPLVATAVGGIPGMVGDAAVLVPPGHPQALRRALLGLIDDRDARERRSAAGRAQSARWPSLDEMVDDLVDNYLDLKSRMRAS